MARDDPFDGFMAALHRALRDVDDEAGRQPGDADPRLLARPVRNARELAVDVRAVRNRLGLSQQQFAAGFGVSVGTVRNWEQGRRQPEGAARVLLRVIEREPAAVKRALVD